MSSASETLSRRSRDALGRPPPLSSKPLPYSDLQPMRSMGEGYMQRNAQPGHASRQESLILVLPPLLRGPFYGRPQAIREERR